MSKLIQPRKTPALLIAVFLSIGISTANAALLPVHSKAFPLRYECDVVPALARWFLTPVSGSAALQATNGWVSFTSGAPQINAYQNGQWSVGVDQPYTAEIRFRTPNRGRFTLTVDDGTISQETLIVSSTELLWKINGIATPISTAASNAIHIVRFAAWTEQNARFVQVWKDGHSIYGPTISTTPSLQTGPITLWGDLSGTEESALEFDYIRMNVSGAFAPFRPQLTIDRPPGAISLSWPLAQRAVYQLETTSDLNAPVWADLGPKIPGLRSTANQTENTTASARFYRVEETVQGAIDQPWTPAIAGPPPVCDNLPALTCTANCLNLVPFTPTLGTGYENYPINGETEAEQYRSYVRAEVRQAIQYAAARVECQAGHWPFGNNRPLGLGDMSEANGNIPGTRDGSPGHPAGTHQNGTDIDVAYYQLDTTNSYIRPICETRIGGVDQQHCVAPPNTLDVWRTAFFLGSLMQHPRLRVIGVDGQAGPALLQAINQLATSGWLPSTIPAIAQSRLKFETSDQGLGWYYFHHQYMHISFMN